MRATILLAAAALACAPQKRIPIRPIRPLEGPDLTLLRFASSDAAGFRVPRGGPCAPFDGEVEVRLVAAATRGSVLIDAFGLAANAPEDLHRTFGLRPLPAEPPPPAPPAPVVKHTAGAAR